MDTFVVVAGEKVYGPFHSYNQANVYERETKQHRFTDLSIHFYDAERHPTLLPIEELLMSDSEVTSLRTKMFLLNGVAALLLVLMAGCVSTLIYILMSMIYHLRN